jgi:hypothetical protein
VWRSLLPLLDVIDILVEEEHSCVPASRAKSPARAQVQKACNEDALASGSRTSQFIGPDYPIEERAGRSDDFPTNPVIHVAIDLPPFDKHVKLES